MNPTRWFLVHIIWNTVFFVLLKMIGILTEFVFPEMIKDQQWLLAKEIIPELLYGIYWVGIQIYLLVYKQYERFALYMMFGLLAFTISRAL